MANGADDKTTPATAVGTDVTLPQVGGSGRTPGPTPTPLTPGSGSSSSGTLSYKMGDLVAERYRILRVIGEGGMGEVYEAEDLLLKEHVALKTLRDHVANDETSILRFKREIQLARKVTHPNVCRLFDVGIDKRGGREAAFLTMELLEGETLSARVRREGRLTIAEALPIAEQICGALAAAHAAGIIHRDLKCANVILVSLLEGAGPDKAKTRAVVTDFGLARVAAEGSEQVTGDGVVGSPAYMAPEQVEGGKRLTAACDIYAFGVVLFEMVTGKLPFVGETPLATAVMRLREPPPSPRSLVPALDAHWERAILACLERDPDERPASAGEVIKILHGESVPAVRPEARRPRKPRAGRRNLRLVIAVLGVAAVIAIASHQSKKSPRLTPPAPAPSEEAQIPEPPEPPDPPDPPGGPPLTGRGSWKIPDLPGVPRRLQAKVQAQVDKAMRSANAELKKSHEQLRRAGIVTDDSNDDESDSEDKGAAAPHDRRSVAILGFKNLSGKKSADYLSVAFAEMLSTELGGEELRTVPGESVARAKRQLALGDADSYAPDTLKRLRRQLDSDFVVTGSYIILGDSGKIRLDLKLQDTSTGEMVMSTAEQGTEADLGDLVAKAGEKVRVALDVSPRSASEREGVRDLMPKKGDVARQYGEGITQLRLQNCGAAHGPLEEAVATDPSYAPAHSALSQVLSCLGYDTRALEEAEKAVALAANLPIEVRLNAEAHLDQLNGNLEKSLASYQELYRRFPDNGDYGLALAKLEMKVGDTAAAKKTLASLRRLPAPTRDNPEIDCLDAEVRSDAPPEERLALVQRAKSRAEEQGARLVLATVLLNEDRILFEVGRYPEAMASASQATAIFQASGDRDGVIQALAGQARVLQKRGDGKGVARLLEQATALGKDLDSVRSLVEFHSAIGFGYLTGGDLRAAENEFTAALHLLERHKTGGHIGAATGPLIAVAVYRGDLARATQLVELTECTERADREDRDGGADFDLGMTLFGHAEIDILRADLDAAREHLQAALAASPRIASMRIDGLIAASIALADGHPSEAEKVIRTVPDRPLDKVWMLSNERSRLFIDALLEQGKVGEARAALDHAAPTLATGETILGKINYGILAAQVKAASGQPADVREAVHELEGLAGIADKHGIVMLARMADLYRGKLLADGGDERGRALLASVAKDAEKRGLESLGVQARKALGTSD